MVIRHVKGPVVFTCTIGELEAILDCPMPHLYAHRDISVCNWHTFQSLGDLGLMFHHIDRSYKQHTTVNGTGVCDINWLYCLPAPVSLKKNVVRRIFWSGWVGFFTEKESHVNLDDTSLEVRLHLTISISSPVRCVTQRRKCAVRIPSIEFFFEIQYSLTPSVFEKFFLSSPKCPYMIWGLPNLLFNGYRRKVAGEWWRPLTHIYYRGKNDWSCTSSSPHTPSSFVH